MSTEFVDGSLEADAWNVGAKVAGPVADDVDRRGRFPAEAVAAMREARLLSAMVPVALGGRGARLPEVSGAVRALAAHCASSALVFAMHQIEVAYLARHGHTDALAGMLEQVASKQLLLANANSEVGSGGDVGRSACAIEVSGDRFSLCKDALAVSFGAYADAVLTTARRHPDAAPDDQIMVVCPREGLHLEQLSEWDAMGLRGTCSNGFRLRAEGDTALIFPEPFSAIASRTGTPVTQVLLGSVWVGLAEAAAARAHAAVRAQARKHPGTRPVSALRLAELTTLLQQARAVVGAVARRYEELKDSDEVEGLGFGLELRNVKVAASSLALEVGNRALAICGIAGYLRSSPYSLDRIVRDLHGGTVMVSNDRLNEASAELLLVQKHI